MTDELKVSALLRETERARLSALVTSNLEIANQQHADDFQLITPFGDTLSKEQYLGAIASGNIRYLLWEPVSPIDVRLYGLAAVMRYRAQVDLIADGKHLGLHHTWHTDLYELRDDRWQVVWSHATRIVEAPDE